MGCTWGVYKVKIQQLNVTSKKIITGYPIRKAVANEIQLLPDLSLRSQQPSSARILVTQWVTVQHCCENFSYREAIKIAIMMQIPNIIVESDSLTTVKSILGQTQGLKQIKPLIKDIRSFASIIRNIRFSYYTLQAL